MHTRDDKHFRRLSRNGDRRFDIACTISEAFPVFLYCIVAIMRKPDIFLILAMAAVMVQHATSLRIGSSLHGLELNTPMQLCL